VVALVPPGPDVDQDIASTLLSIIDAVSELQNPGAPRQLAHVDTKASLALYAADDYRGGVLICDEINSIVHSTAVAGVYAWLRADGSAL
jgi:hypothetical protein